MRCTHITNDSQCKSPHDTYGSIADDAVLGVKMGISMAMEFVGSQAGADLG